MENLLLKYLGKDFNTRETGPVSCDRPFITISRQCGCPSKLIAQKLADRLNAHPHQKPAGGWHCINKEVILEAARELELEPEKVRLLFDAERRGTLDDILSSFSSNYKSTVTVLKMIRKVVQTFSSKGYVILIGRGGVAITQNCRKALHIRLQAPVEWRIQEVSRHQNLSEEDARHLAIETDKKRNAMIELFLNRKPDDSLFDLIFNCSRLSPDEIVASTLHVMEMKKMI